MKILYLTNIPSPYRVDFFNELGKLCQLTVLFERESAGNRDYRWKAFDFKNFKFIFLKGKKIGIDASMCFTVVKYLKKNYDAIILGGYSSPTYMIAIEYMRMRRIPFFLNVDGGIVKSDSRLRYWIKWHYISKASGWLSTGKMTDDYLLHYGAKKDYIYHYPFTSVKEGDFYYPNEKERKYYKQQLSIVEKRTALTVGQYIPRKGFEFLIQAAGRLNKEYGVYVIGGIPDKHYLEIQKDSGADNVHFLDFMEKEKLKKYYLAADVFVFPTREDIWGLVLNEAMSFGLPCVASRKANASLELIEDEQCGYFINPEDVKDIADKIELLLKDDNLRICMGRKAFEKIGDFTIEKMAKRHIDIIKQWTECSGGGD